jgi:hypothetical protein
VKLLLPALMGLILAAFGARLGGPPVAVFLGAIGMVSGWGLGRMVRAGRMRQAPPPRPGETPLLHGPLQLMQASGPRDCWAYLSDQRLSLQPADQSEGVELELAKLDELRPIEKRWKGGLLTLVVAGEAWRIQVPDVLRWEKAIRAAVRR